MLKNLIDLHAHILHRIDDGAKNLKRSLFLGKAARAEGISTIVATPHYCEEDSKGMLCLRMERLAEVKKAFIDNNIDIEILSGFEVNASAALKTRKSFGALTLCGTKWILLERSFTEEDAFDEAFEAVLGSGLRPLLAHPERYDCFLDDMDKLSALIERGAWSQLTASAVAGFQGSAVQQWCISALESNCAHVIATDMHNLDHRPPCMKLASEIVEAKLGEERMNEIFLDNPRRILGRMTI